MEFDKLNVFSLKFDVTDNMENRVHHHRDVHFVSFKTSRSVFFFFSLSLFFSFIKLSKEDMDLSGTAVGPQVQG